MQDDREIVRKAIDFQSRARDFRMLDLPGYFEWSNRRMKEGESAAYIAHLDATSAWLLPEEAARMNEKDYDEMLEDLKIELEKAADKQSKL